MKEVVSGFKQKTNSLDEKQHVEKKLSPRRANGYLSYEANGRRSNNSNARYHYILSNGVSQEIHLVPKLRQGLQSAKDTKGSSAGFKKWFRGDHQNTLALDAHFHLHYAQLKLKKPHAFNWRLCSGRAV